MAFLGRAAAGGGGPAILFGVDAIVDPETSSVMATVRWYVGGSAVGFLEVHGDLVYPEVRLAASGHGARCRAPPTWFLGRLGEEGVLAYLGAGGLVALLDGVAVVAPALVCYVCGGPVAFVGCFAGEPTFACSCREGFFRGRLAGAGPALLASAGGGRVPVPAPARAVSDVQSDGGGRCGAGARQQANAMQGEGRRARRREAHALATYRAADPEANTDADADADAELVQPPEDGDGAQDTDAMALIHLYERMVCQYRLVEKNAAAQQRLTAAAAVDRDWSCIGQRVRDLRADTERLLRDYDDLFERARRLRTRIRACGRHPAEAPPLLLHHPRSFTYKSH